MKNCLAIWHYPHRSITENVEFFAAKGFEYVSFVGRTFAAEVESNGERLADVIIKSKVGVSVHAKMPDSHDEREIEIFKHEIDCIAAWQKRYGLVSVLSFDVPDGIRDNISVYIDYVLDKVENCKVAVEDFGLTADECRQIEYLKGNKRFGYLLDIGHMYMRLTGKAIDTHITLFNNSALECAASENPGYNEFLAAFNSKEFPVFEIHLHNNDGKDDLHQFLEDGTLDINMVSRVIKDFGFDGILTIESAPGFRFECAGQEADDRILKTFEYWKNILKTTEN